MILPIDVPCKEKERFDFLGASTFTFGMILVLLGITNGEDWGWSSIPVLLSLGLGVASLLLFVLTERKVEHPMIDLSLFRNRPFLIGNLSGGLSFVAMFANTMILPFYLQGVLNYRPAQVGMILMIFPVVMAVVAPLSGHASDKFGPMVLTTSGLIITGLGLFYFSTLSATASFYHILPGSVLMGLGTGMFQSPNNSSVMSSVPPLQTGYCWRN